MFLKTLTWVPDVPVVRGMVHVYNLADVFEDASTVPKPFHSWSGWSGRFFVFRFFGVWETFWEIGSLKNA